MGEVLQNGKWRMVHYDKSYTHTTYVSSTSWQDKENGATPPHTSIPAWILNHMIYSCFQR
jgi:hypothetical protein